MSVPSKFAIHTLLISTVTTGAFVFADQPTQLQEAEVHAEKTGGAGAAEKKDMEASAAAADKWLKLLDRGAYNESWEAASLTFKLKVPQASWLQILDVSRKGLGAATARTIAEQRPAIDPQGLPKGKYMVIFYNTTFPGKPNTNELVTLMQLDDGTWKVLTYLVK